MGVGADRLEASVHCVLDVGGADEILAQALLQRLDAPAVPEKAVSSPGAEVGNPQRPFVRERPQPLDLRPQLGFGASVKHIEIEAAHAAHGRAGAQFVDDGERRDLPHRGLGPEPGEAQLVLPVPLRQFVFRQAEVGQIVHECRLEYLACSVERIAREPDHLVLGQSERAGVIELVGELASRR